MSEHSSIMGGSTAERRIMCPGSAIAEAGRPDTKSQAAEDGTRKHGLIERVMRGVLPPEAVPPEDFDDVDAARRMFFELCAAKGLQVMPVRFEQRVALDVPGVFGTIDVLGLGDNVGLICDWKFGYAPVDAAHNIQLGTYAAGAISQFPELTKDINRWVFAIVQPTQGLSTWETDNAWIEHLRERIREAADKIRAGIDERRSGSWCKYCKGAIDCPELRSDLVKIGKQPINPISYAEALAAAERAEAFAKNVRGVVEAALLRGEQVLGYKVVEKVGRRVWSIPGPSLIDAVPEVATVDVLSPAALEKKLGKAEFKARAEQYVTKQSSGLTIAPDSDKRPAVDLAAPLCDVLGLGPGDRIL